MNNQPYYPEHETQWHKLYLSPEMLAFYRKADNERMIWLRDDCRRDWRRAEHDAERRYSPENDARALVTNRRYLEMIKVVHDRNGERFAAILDAIEGDTSGDLDPRYSVEGQVL